MSIGNIEYFVQNINSISYLIFVNNLLSQKEYRKIHVFYRARHQLILVFVIRDVSPRMLSAVVDPLLMSSMKALIRFSNCYTRMNLVFLSLIPAKIIAGSIFRDKSFI